MKDTLYNYVALQVSRTDPSLFQKRASLVKYAMNPYVAFAMLNAGDTAANIASSALSTGAKAVSQGGSALASGYGNALSGAQSIGYALGDNVQSTYEYFMPDSPKSLSTETQIIANLMDDIRDTEQAEQYLREADKLRRRTRIRLRRNKRDENLRKTVADSRFF